MLRDSNLKTFNLYDYLKNQNAHSSEVPYFLADQNTYKSAGIAFPFRTFAYGVGISYSGKGDLFKIGSADYIVKSGCLTTIGPGMVCQWTGTYSAMHDTIYFTENLFTHMLSGTFLQSFPFLFPGGNHVIQLNKEQVNLTQSLFKSMKAFQKEESVMAGLVYSLLMLVNSFHSTLAARTISPGTSNRENIVRSFRQLVAAHFQVQKGVDYYASSLNITPKYLSEVLLSQTGKSAKTHIGDFIFMEAKSLLKQTNMSIQEICYWLGYEDAAYFARTFKKWAGLTPSAYREG